MDTITVILLAFKFLVFYFATYWSFAFVVRLSVFLVLGIAKDNRAQMKFIQSFVPTILWSIFWLLCQF
jgi:hypothetical protein